MKKNRKKLEWVDFSLKINFIYEKLFQKNKEKLISNFFSEAMSEQDRKKHLKTMNNWLSGKSKKPYKFNLGGFKIYNYSMPDGSALFSLDMFEFWSIEAFKERVNKYLNFQKENSSLEERMKYIYYFDLDSECLNYYKLVFPNIQKPYEVNLYSNQLVNNMFYQGEMIEFQSMLYITVKNEFDYMQFIFENFAMIFNQEVRVFGTAQCKDYITRKPKAYIVLLTSSLLTKEEKKQFQHKLNRSNYLIAQPFTRYTTKNMSFLVENFSKKIKDLARDIEPYKKEQDFYVKLALRTFTRYEKIAKKLYNNESYFVSDTKSVKFLLFNSLAKKNNFNKDGAPQLNIVYTLSPLNITLLEIDSPYFSDIFKEQIHLVEEHSLELNYLFIVSDYQLISNKVLNKLIELSKVLPIKIIENLHPHYEEIILPQNENFILYKIYNDKGNYLHITKHTKDKIDINRDFKRHYNQAISLSSFIEETFPLNGKWYCYSFGSKRDNNFYHTVELEINNNEIIGNFPSGISYGVVDKYEEFTLLIFNNSLIKLRNSIVKNKIFHVSIIAKEFSLHHKDLLIFGLMSRKAIQKENICKLLNAIHKKESEDFRLKIDDGFDSLLAEYINS